MKTRKKIGSIHDFFKQCPKTRLQHTTAIKKITGITDLSYFEGSVIFGTARLGREIHSILRRNEIEIMGFSDNDKRKWGRRIDGLKVTPPSNLQSEQKIIIASKSFHEILSQLRVAGHKNVFPHYVLTVLYPRTFPNPTFQIDAAGLIRERKNIMNAYCKLEDEHSKSVFLSLLKFRVSLTPFDLPKPTGEPYFPDGFWSLSDTETYVDAGAYDGDTLKQFITHKGAKFKRYYAIEPDQLNYKKLLKNIPRRYSRKITPLQLGLGAKKGSVPFASCGKIDSSVRNEGKDTVEITTLDELCRGEEVSTIKMDVEGYESEAISGAKNTIKKHKPKLALSAYHYPRHLWQLQLQIMSIRKDYRFYLRHHGLGIDGTILYAI
ncbi:MAG: FkbM family methyltransferase [Candidatus Altiarchaeota archaeon]|nr:FkbM family methyltransferase [Candidatus Altiarchaeota archaeon]